MSTVYVQYPNGNVLRTTHPEFHQEAKRLTKAEGERLYREQAVDELRAWIKPNTRVYTILRSVSPSGMSRRVSVVIVKDGELATIDYGVATVLGWKLATNGEGIVVSGCGMDAGFHLVYSLGRQLWPDGTPEPHGTRNGEPDSDGGYALRHSWL
ncbi:hypothetical protein LMG10661_00776 [Ralstonia syzygii subsp. syzygii]|nr:hypothetical protein LMG10661_00776 [Ralstonia syzygii subsp. syzygii]